MIARRKAEEERRKAELKARREAELKKRRQAEEERRQAEQARRQAEEAHRLAELNSRREAEERKKAAWQKLCSNSDCSNYICTLSKEDQEAIKMAVASWTISKDEWERRGERFHTQNKNSFADKRMRALEKNS